MACQKSLKIKNIYVYIKLEWSSQVYQCKINMVSLIKLFTFPSIQ